MHAMGRLYVNTLLRVEANVVTVGRRSNRTESRRNDCAGLGRSGAAPVHELACRFGVDDAASKTCDQGNDRGYRVVVVLVSVRAECKLEPSVAEGAATKYLAQHEAAARKFSRAIIRIIGSRGRIFGFVGDRGVAWLRCNWGREPGLFRLRSGRGRIFFVPCRRGRGWYGRRRSRGF